MISLPFKHLISLLLRLEEKRESISRIFFSLHCAYAFFPRLCYQPSPFSPRQGIPWSRQGLGYSKLVILTSRHSYLFSNQSACQWHHEARGGCNFYSSAFFLEPRMSKNYGVRLMTFLLDGWDWSIHLLPLQVSWWFLWLVKRFNTRRNKTAWTLIKPIK